MDIVVVGAGEMGGAIGTHVARMHAVAVRGSKLGSESAASVIGDSHGKIAEASGYLHARPEKSSGDYLAV